MSYQVLICITSNKNLVIDKVQFIQIISCIAESFMQQESINLTKKEEKMKNKDFQNKFNKDNRLASNYIASLMNIKDSRDDRRFFKCNIKCSLCSVVINDARESHNALPLSENRCCENCNNKKVIPARLSYIFNSERTYDTQ
jgi:hypothetical protein